MADPKDIVKPSSAIPLAVGIIVLFLAWILSGGPTRPSAKSPIFDFSSPDAIKKSAAVVMIEEVRVRDAREVKEEYIVLRARDDISEPINISMWRLETTGGAFHFLGKGTTLPIANQINRENDILLSAGERAVISSARSPLGVSLKLNICAGFLTQFQNFIPDIPKQCPGEFSSCTIDINRNLNYESCREQHKGDVGFILPEWRIFLNQEKKLWDRAETIRLIDNRGVLIDIAQSF